MLRYVMAACGALALGLAAARLTRLRRLKSRLERAAADYRAGRWLAALEGYRAYLRAAAPTLRHESADEILRYMAFAVGEADLEANLGGVKRSLEQFHRLRERAELEPGARGELPGARSRLLAALDDLRFDPAGTRLAAAAGRADG